MNKETVVASSIENVPHFVAFDVLAKQRFSTMELENLLVYIIDTVDSSAIPYLAEQFDVLGYNGFRLAKNEEEQREIIKRAIELKRYKGTVWAVKEALKSIGYPDAVLKESVGSGPTGWAEFRIELDAGDNAISDTQTDELVKMILEYKNERSHLMDVTYKITITDDALAISDDSSEYQALDEDDSIVTGGDFKYNGQYRYNGEKNYSSDSDVLEMQIINV